MSEIFKGSEDCWVPGASDASDQAWEEKRDKIEAECLNWKTQNKINLAEKREEAG